MRRMIFAVAIAGICVVLGSCAAEQAYMGKWEGMADGEKVGLEFLEKDVFIVKTEGDVTAGTWEVDSEGQLRISIDDTKGVGKLLDKERLLIKNENGDDAWMFERVRKGPK